MRAAIAVALLATSCAAPAPATEIVPVPFRDPPAMGFDQARAICRPRAQAAAAQARSTALLELRERRYTSPYVIETESEAAARRAGDAAYSGCLAEQGWRLETRRR